MAILLKNAREPEITLSSLTTVLENLDACVYAADLETHELVYMNSYVRKMINRDMTAGAKCWEVLQKDQRGPCPFCNNKRLLTADGTSSGVHTWEFQNTLNNRWYLISDQAIRWTDGRWARLEIATDITARKTAEEQVRDANANLEQRVRERTHELEQEIAERKRMEEALRRSEENYRLLTDTMHETMTVIAADGTVLFANARTAKNFCSGRPGDVISRNITDFIPPETAQKHLRDYKCVIEGNAPVTREVKTVLQGRDQWFLNTLSPVRFGEKETPAVLSMSVDITERRKTEEMLRESWTKFKQLAENINEVFWVRDAVTREMLYISPAYETIWGRTCQSLYKRPESFLESVHPDDTERVVGAVRKQKDGVPYNQEYRIIRPDGEVRWVWARLFFVRNDAGEVIRYAGVAEDITERRKAENDLRRNAARLEALSRRLVEVQESERRQIAKDLHDEIGQSLTVLKLGIEKLAADLPEQGRRDADLLRDIAGDLMDKVRNLSLDLRPSMLDDLGLLPALLWQAETFAEKTGVQVDFRHSGIDRRFPREIETTAYRVAQEALTNVARHAGVSEAALTAIARKGTLLLRIDDSGRGFDLSAVPPGAAAAGLSGIRERLAIVKGRLTIDAAPGKGARLTAEIPL